MESWKPVIAFALLVTFSGCRGRTDESQVEALQTVNLVSKHFGLKAGELALTLDDGPGSRTFELAKWLAEEGVPVTFFMVGKNAKAMNTVVAQVAELSKQYPNVDIPM